VCASCSPVLIVNKAHIAHTTCCHQFHSPNCIVMRMARVTLAAQVGMEKIGDQHRRMSRWGQAHLWKGYGRGSIPNRLMTVYNIFMGGILRNPWNRWLFLFSPHFPPNIVHCQHTNILNTNFTMAELIVFYKFHFSYFQPFNCIVFSSFFIRQD